MTSIGVGDVGRLVRGARPFATGVNSSALHVLQDWAADALEAAAVPLRALADCRDDDGFCAVTVLGSPSALAENLPSGHEPMRAVAALGTHIGMPIRGVLPLNTAGENAVIALVAAAASGTELVDADGCGRVFPRVEQTMFALAGIPLFPAAVVSPFGELTIIDAPTRRAAALIPKLVAASGGWAFFAGYAMRGADLSRTANPGTVSRFLDAEPGAHLAGVGHRVLCRATITAVEIPHRAAGARISVLLRESSPQARVLRAEADQEFFLVLGDGARLASAPDDILLISENGEVVDPDRCAVGMRVDVVVIDVPSVWHRDPSSWQEGSRS